MRIKSRSACIIAGLLIITHFSYGQFKKGSRMVGVSVGSAFFNSASADYSFPAPTTGYSNSNTSFGVTLNPSMGWFISDHVVTGTQINWSYNHQKSFDKDDASGNTSNKNIYKNFSIGIGGFARNYFSTEGKVLPYAQFSLNIGTGSSSNDGFTIVSTSNPPYKNTYTGKSSGDFFANTSLSGGFTKMLNQHTGLDFSLGYTFSYYKSTTKTVSQIDYNNNGSIDETRTLEPLRKFTQHGIMLNVGFQVFLDRGKK